MPTRPNFSPAPIVDETPDCHGATVRDRFRLPVYGSPNLCVSGSFVLACLLPLAGLLGCQGETKNKWETAAVGQPISEIELLPLIDYSVDSDGNATVSSASAAELVREGRLVKSLPEKITLIHLWGTWCGPCRMEYPELAAMVAKHDDSDDFAFLSISCERGPDASFQSLRDETASFFGGHGIAHDVYCDPGGKTRSAAARLLGGPDLFFPSSLLFDHDGRLVGAWEGYSPSGVKEMETVIDRLLAAPKQDAG
ncbi:MAG: TlpA family protein disulfide reductase [Planctomycetota bacterium]